MAVLALSLILIFVLWAIAFSLMDRQRVSRVTAIGIFAITISMIATNLEYVTENAGTLSATTLALSATTTGYLILLNLFFLIISLVNMYDYLSEQKYLSAQK